MIFSLKTKEELVADYVSRPNPLGLKLLIETCAPNFHISYNPRKAPEKPPRKPRKSGVMAKTMVGA